MAMRDAGMFTVKEINRLKILQDVLDRNLRLGQAADMLGITPRHCSRLLKRYRQSGPLGINNQRRGRTGNRQLPVSLTELALNIIRERYLDFGPTLAQEKLAETHGLVLGKETIRRLMIKTGLWIPRRKRPPKIHQPRYRRPCTGELIQIDGCDHHWFENRGRPCTALVYVDDATSRLMHLLFVKSESTFTYFEATRGYIENTVTAIKPAYSGSIISTPPRVPVKPSLPGPCAASISPHCARKPVRQKAALNAPI